MWLRLFFISILIKAKTSYVTKWYSAQNQALYVVKPYWATCLKKKRFSRQKQLKEVETRREKTKRETLQKSRLQNL